MAHIRMNTVFQQGRSLIAIFNSNLGSKHASYKTLITKQELCNRNASSVSSISGLKNCSVHKDEKKIVKSVFISQSNDIFTNLALEDWMYKNFDFTNHHVMLLWVNSPCVVIGRNQNPWLEANVKTLEEKGVPVARRNSGGGAVYHDNGNLNLTFFTPVERYSRKQNLELIGQGLQREWSLKTEINKKEDIVIDEVNKISGTASRLGRPNSYHHCTLLVNVNKHNLSEALHRNDNKGITESTATDSVPSPVKNLSEVNPGIGVQRLINSLGWEYLRTSPISRKDGGWDQVQKQRGFQMINPTDEWFPGLEQIRSEFESWDWRFGRTPKFHVTKSFPVPQRISANGNMAEEEQLRVTIKVASGLVEDVIMMIPPSLMMTDSFVEDVKLMTNIRGRRFSEDALDELNASFSINDSLRNDGKQFVADCVRKVMASV